MILFGTMSAATASAQVVPPPTLPPAVPVPPPSMPASMPRPSAPVPTPVPSPAAPKKNTPKTGRNGGTPGYAPEGQSALASKPGKPGGTPGLLAGDWATEPKQQAPGVAGLVGRDKTEDVVTIKVDDQAIVFTTLTPKASVQRYALDGTRTKVQTAEGEFEARAVIDGEKLVIETFVASGTTVVTWFIENGNLVREQQFGEGKLRRVYKKRGG